MAKILIADDHSVVRLGIEMLLRDIDSNNHFIRQASNGEQVLMELEKEEYDILVTDMNMPEPSGFTLLEKAMNVQPHLKVLIISVNPESFFAPLAFRMGVYGFISKNERDTELKKALKAIIAGEIYIPIQMRGKFFAPGSGDNNVFNLLSRRELEITLLMLKGMAVQDISNLLSISASTTSTLKGRVFKKLNVNSVFELAELARTHSVITEQSIPLGK